MILSVKLNEAKICIYTEKIYILIHWTHIPPGGYMNSVSQNYLLRT